MNPPTIDHIKREIVTRRLSLSPKLADLAHWTFEHQAEVAFGTLQSVSRECRVPQSTVQRLAATLGFSGFKQMKAAYQIHLAQEASRRHTFHRRMLDVQSHADNVE